MLHRSESSGKILDEQGLYPLPCMVLHCLSQREVCPAASKIISCPGAINQQHCCLRQETERVSDGEHDHPSVNVVQIFQEHRGFHPRRTFVDAVLCIYEATHMAFAAHEHLCGEQPPTSITFPLLFCRPRPTPWYPGEHTERNVAMVLMPLLYLSLLCHLHKMGYQLLRVLDQLRRRILGPLNGKTNAQWPHVKTRGSRTRDWSTYVA